MTKCVVCGCTELDCSGCIQRTGQACWWFGPDLCSACAMAMKGLSLWQPWAGLIAIGEKTIETRYWETSYRGNILICSAQKYDENWKRISSRPNAQTAIRPFDHWGHALCVAELVDCRLFDWRDTDASMVKLDYSRPGVLYSWVLEDIRPVTPFAVRGRQRLFTINESILRKAV